MDASADFHVVSLWYTLRPSDKVTYESPQPVEFETTEARLRLVDGTLTAEMKIHVSTETEARGLVDPVLRAWEVDADLRGNRGELRFKFDRADIINRSPASPAPGVVIAIPRGEVGYLRDTVHVSIHSSRANYPPPPGPFRLTPDAESLLHRYGGYLDGREPPFSMAYFCLTVLEAKAGGRPAAAAAYRISEPVLRKIANLTSERGDRATARKVTRRMQPLTGPEAAWLEAAVKMLIWRLGDSREIMTLPIITLADLPPL